MKHKKDISDLIRENQHKLNERPSPRAWRRLESKLDNQHSRHQTSVYKQFAMVAAVIALVAVASLITLTINNQQNMAKNQMADAGSVPSAFALPVQELETVYTDANEDLHKVVEFQRSLKRIYASNPNPIAEGTQHNKMVAANEIQKTNNTSTISESNDGMLAVKETQPKAKTSSQKPNESKYAKEVQKEIVETNSSNKRVIATYAAEDAGFQTDAVVAAATVAEPEMEEMKNEVADAVSVEKIEYKDETMADAVVESSPVPAAFESVKKKDRKAWYLGTWKYDEKLKRNEKFQIFQKGEKTQLVVSNSGDKNIICNLISSDNNRVTFQTPQTNIGYNIRIENGKYVIYKNDQDYGLLIEKVK